MALAALAVSAGLPLAAANAAGLIVSPRPAERTGLSYFLVKLRGGHARAAGVIELRNPTTRSMRVVLSAVDGETLGTLGSAYAQPHSRVHGATTWLRLGRGNLTLAPGATVAVPVSISTPRRATPGDYLAGVSVEQLGQRARQSASRGVSIASVVRYVIGVEMSLPGKRRPRIVFTGASLERQPSGLVFLLLARNGGNVILQGVHGSAVITRGTRTVAHVPLGPGTFVSGTAIAYPVSAFSEHPPQGTRYRVRALLRYGRSVAYLDTYVTFGRAQAAAERIYAPRRARSGGTAWWKILGLGLLIAYALGTSLLLLLRQRRSRDDEGSGPPGEPSARHEPRAM